ncbi:MAG: T9SS type B sorting domain-containing protein [Bacteroidia bacterium]
MYLVRSVNNKIFYLACLLLLLAGNRAHATHNRAGEITFTQVSTYTFEVTLITYTDTRSVEADRPVVTLLWGDGKQNDIPRNSQTVVGPNIYKNVYVSRHTYNGPGSYTIQFIDPNRIKDILNIYQSVSVPFYVETELIIDPQRGYNRSPVLLQLPIDYACPNRIFYHNPNAYDPDGDSLVFTHIAPKRDKGKDVPDYRIPTASNSFTINPRTGELIWDMPTIIGIVNIAILIEEYRKGIRIGYIIRDMQIIVQNCNNNPPVIKEIKDTCVEAGTNIKLFLNVHATDPDNGDEITLSASGGPFLQKIKPSQFSPSPAVAKDSVDGIFSWDIDCNHIRKEPYRVVFRAVDDDRVTPLTDIEHFDIKVVGPAPKNLTTQAIGNGVQLNWQKPVCDNVRGYYVYRRIDSSFWNHAYCETGVPAYTNFVLIDTILNPNTLAYYDDNRGQSLSPGIVYCYRITAIYLNEGQFEPAEGYASNEACAELKKDVPVITHVSVRTTSIANGSIYVAWSKPTQLDTLQNPGPYEYRIYHGDGFNGQNFQLLQTFSSVSFRNLSDTSYIDTLKNTSAKPHSYKVEFYYTSPISNKLELLGKTITTSSVFLTIRRAHHKLELKWHANVPWKNRYFIIYKKNPSTANWDSIATTLIPNYTDTGLENGTTYCYKIEAVGSYFTKGFTDPLINFSQEVCTSPRDTILPCSPTLSVTGNCDERTADLSWQAQNRDCDADVTYYKIYYSPLLENKYVFVDSVMGKGTITYKDIRDTLRYSMAGCYKITAVDSFDNESPYSNEICIDNCPIYELPNVITVNGDEFNDLFRPLSTYRFVESVDIIIINRWGQEVFRTTDPLINWNGEDQKTGRPLAEGVYFYYGNVNEIYLRGNVSRSVQGTVHLLR